MEDLVVLVEYDPLWPQLAADEMARIREVCGSRLLALEHIGSTAVPGLAAKPLIDLMGGVAALEEAHRMVEPLARLGYVYLPELEQEVPNRLYLRKPAAGRRTHSLHLVELDGPFWIDHLLFRDYLRRSPQACAEYAQLKTGLAGRFSENRFAYTSAKGPFILACVERARSEQDGV